MCEGSAFVQSGQHCRHAPEETELGRWQCRVSNTHITGIPYLCLNCVSADLPMALPPTEAGAASVLCCHRAG